MFLNKFLCDSSVQSNSLDMENENDDTLVKTMEGLKDPDANPEDPAEGGPP